MRLRYLKKSFRFYGKIIIYSIAIFSCASTVAHAAPNQSVSAPPPPASVADSCTKSFLGLEPWFKFLPDADFYGNTTTYHNKCDIKCFNLLDQGSVPNACGRTKSDIPLVLLAIIDDLLRIAGLVALGFVLYGSFQFVASQGSPDSTAKARGTIINALLGMAVASIAIAVVSFLGNKFGAGT